MCCLSCEHEFSKIAGRGLCPSCYMLHRRAGTLVDFPRITRSNAELIEEYEFLREGGVSKIMAAKQLGIKVTSLERAQYRFAKTLLDSPVPSTAY